MNGSRPAHDLLQSFNYAFEGIIHVLRTQRNLRIHFVIAMVVIGAAAALGVGRDDLILLLIAIAFVLVTLVVIATKALTRSGTPLRGGLPSGHSGIAFAGWMAATYVSDDHHRFLISSLTFVMALLVAQTRVEAGVHSRLEVLYGGALGALVTLVVFQVLA